MYTSEKSLSSAGSRRANGLQLETKHEWLKRNRLSAETIDHFGLGYCRRGILQQRICFPLHGPRGQLVGYAGRRVEDRNDHASNPKYRLLSLHSRVRATSLYRSVILYNMHRINSPVEDLIVVQDFESVWWLWQSGHRNVVAVMGSATTHQGREIINLAYDRGKVWICCNNDCVGMKCMQKLLRVISPTRFVRCVTTTARRPTDIPEQVLELMFC